MSRIHPKKKYHRHSIDISDKGELSLLASIRPATPLFHRTLRRSVQDSRTYQAIIPLSMGRIHYVPNHLSELKSMLGSSMTPLKLRRASQHVSVERPYRPPSTLKRRLVAKSPFPMRNDQKLHSPPDTPTRKTPTPAMKNFKLPKGIIEEYEGEYLNGLSHGEGKALYSNGDTYQGQWVEGKKHGIGTYFYNYYQATFHGDWADDEKNGFGVMKFSNGDEIEGFWENGFEHGENITMSYNNGCSYTGSAYKGLRNGKGKMLYYEGAEYEGLWKDDIREGLGFVSFKELWYFEGYFHKDTTEGPGILVYKTSDLSTVLKFNNKKLFHPLIPYLPVLQDFSRFLSLSHHITDVYIFSTNPGTFRGGKLNG